MRLKAPAGVTSCSVGGVEHAVGEDGHVTVPDGGETALLEHGFTLADEGADAVGDEGARGGRRGRGGK